METLDQVHNLFEKQLRTKLGHPPKHGEVVLFTNVPGPQLATNSPMSARYYGLVQMQQGHDIYVTLHVFGEPFNIIVHPSALLQICDDNFLANFVRCLRPIQVNAIRDWQNFSEGRDGNRRTTANLNWATQLGLVRYRLTDKMRHWELTDLGYALRRWLKAYFETHPTLPPSFAQETTP